MTTRAKFRVDTKDPGESGGQGPPSETAPCHA